MNRVYLGLGSNLGEREAYIEKALDSLENTGSCRITAVSPVYETSPFGEPDQNNFLNFVIEIETGFDLPGILGSCKMIEKFVGRIKRSKWGPREIDIDILLFNDEVFESESLSIPHKDLINRDFFLKPILDINGDIVHPASGVPLKSFYNELKNTYIENIYYKQIKPDANGRFRFTQ